MKGCSLITPRSSGTIVNIFSDIVMVKCHNREDFLLSHHDQVTQS